MGTSSVGGGVMVNRRRCLDCRQKFVMKHDSDERCPRCLGEQDAALPRNEDPTRVRRPDHYNFSRLRRGRYSPGY